MASSVLTVMALAARWSAPLPTLFVGVSRAGTAGLNGCRGSPAPGAKRRRDGSSHGAVLALSAEDPQAVEVAATVATFFLWGAPPPLALSAMFARAEEADSTKVEARSASPRVSSSDESIEPRDMLWAFPSFGVFLRDPETAPQDMPKWVRWFFVVNVWAAIAWYLYYKVLVEEELRERYQLGIGGYTVIVPFALGLTGGIYGQLAFGSLTADPFCDIWSSGFYLGFLWIYINQFFLYQKVNKLYVDNGLAAPLDEFGLLVPGWNFVTGIRQIHFLAEHWARERGEEPRPDAFCGLFPFATKPTLSFFELITTPSLWIRLDLLLR